MATTPILGILFIAVISRCDCESTNGYSHSNVNAASQIGDLLKPPPLPPLSPIVPVPFHGGTGRIQRQNLDIGYQYQPPSSPLSPPPLAPSPDFKFPAPFYKQYNFNFVPPPQPFSTTPSPSIFQKVSGWLFPSKEVSYESGLTGLNSITPLKKDCNPCNLVPWIPVLRYKVGSENEQQSISPTYGSPSGTAYTSLQSIGQYRPQYSNPNSYDQQQQSFSGGVPHEVYGPPKQSKPATNSFTSLSSTYGPPSPTHTVPILQINPISSTLTLSGNPYDLSSTSYGTPNIPIGPPSSSYGLPVSFNSISSSTIKTPTAIYGSPPYDNNRFLSTTYSPISPNYYPEVLNKELPSQSDVEILDDIKPATELELPKVSSPTGFKNSYGEIITNTYALDIPYSASATGAESNKIKTEVLPYDNIKLVTPNTTVALANPAPFTLNRGRNIHTLQPVALPNLSVSPLPPIFNARPFRPIPSFTPPNAFHAGFRQHTINNVKVEKSVPISEFTHSIEYPTTVIQSPVIDIDVLKPSNQTKAYRNIPNSLVIDDVRDISSQASEDHISAAKSQPDSSFESTGADFGNDLYEAGLPIPLNIKSSLPSNHKPDFADLRGIKDEDVDKYRTDSNLQNIDSPLLYLKPSAPHKDYENFVTVSTPGNANEYEMYDDIPTTTLSPQQSTYTSAWDESRTYFSDLSPPREEQDQDKRGKIIQIIVPYTTGQKSDIEPWPKNWKINSEKDFLARKVHSNTENYSFTTSTTTETYNIATATDGPQTTITEYNDADRQNNPAILNHLYDVKEPPFDIIKLQHTIDDWTEQEYSNSKYVRTPQRTRSSEKYAKQIPDDYFTTTMNPLSSYVTSTNNYNYDFYDHEGSSSMQHTVTDIKNSSLTNLYKEYNSIERTKSDYNSAKNENPDEIQKLHIYTAASSFRTSTTTPAPWSEIQTSISPLTKEKVYVVTSKPWREKPKAPEYEYDVDAFESKKTESDSTARESDDLPFKSPRFSDRPYGFQTTGAQNHLHLDISSKEWHHSINDLRSSIQNEHLSLFEGSEQKDNIYVEEDSAIPKTAA